MDNTKLPGSEGNEPERPNYVIHSAAFAFEPQPPIEWMIENLIPAVTVSVFYGDPGSKKTYSLLSMAVCVAMGKPWLGMKTKPGKVLFVDEEMGESWMRRRLRASIKGELGDENIAIEFVSFAGYKLDSKEGAAQLQNDIEEHKSKLVILDALSEIMDGDENAKKDTSPVFIALKRIAEKTGCTIIVIHHANKSGGYRGSSAIKGHPDLMIKVQSDNDSKFINFQSEKVRHIEDIKFTAVAYWNDDDDQFYLLPSETKTKEKPMNKSQSYVIKYLTRHGPSSLPDIMGAADNCSPGGARIAVYDLVDLGKVYRTNPEEKGRGAVAIYDLAKETSNEEQPTRE